MSNKLKKKIVCCLCDKTIPYTEDCQKLFDKDVCPECAAKVTEMVNRIIDNKDLPDHVAVEPEYIVNADGFIKFSGFGLVRK